jgi:nucleotidyltransferase/DNA polymerase involved in DNA repair
MRWNWPRWNPTSVATAYGFTNWLAGIDHNPVISNRVRKQVSAEDTFPEDIQLTKCETHIQRLAEKVWTHSDGLANVE